MNYRKYTVEDFVLDPRFRKWVFNPDKEVNLFWEEWAVQHPDKVNLLKEARMLLLHLPHEKHLLRTDEIDALWSSIDQQTNASSLPSAANSKVVPLHAEATLKKYVSTEPKQWDYIRTGRVAASLLIILTFCLSYLLGEIDNPSATMKREVIKKVNAWGQRSTIYLSDGTEVHLNAGSHIEYEKHFNSRERLVTLHGEAFFNVAKDKHRPFRVITSDIITEALGTSFNVNTYDPEKIEIALVTGKVSVDKMESEKESTRLMLHPGEGASYQSEKGFTKYHFDPQQVLSWKEGVIYFKNADEFTVFNTLEQWYGVSFEKVNRSNKHWDYSGSFEKKSLEHVLLSIAFAMDFEFDIRQKTVNIKYK